MSPPKRSLPFDTEEQMCGQPRHADQVATATKGVEPGGMISVIKVTE